MVPHGRIRYQRVHFPRDEEVANSNVHPAGSHLTETLLLKRHELADDAFIIAEVGQNHQGDPKIASDFVEKFAALGADAVKFQTRDNRYLFSADSYDQPYNSPTAFADKYGDHREALELPRSAVRDLRQQCADLGVRFMSTPFDEPSLEFLVEIDVEIIKVASFDLGNVAFLDRIAQAKKPVVMSVGGGNFNHIMDSVEVFDKHGSELVVLHCVSEYPCTYDRLGLENLQKLIDVFPDHTIGLSDHFNGTLSGPIGYMAGARVFEKHVTFNRAWKGTDHSFALEPRGFETFVRDIRRVPEMFGSKPKDEIGSEPVFKKLGKSVAALENIDSGDILTLENLRGKIFQSGGIPVREMAELVGKKATRAIAAGEMISKDDFN